MIIKNFELKNKNLKNYGFFLLYGNSQGHIQETITNVLKPILPKNIHTYDELEIIKDPQSLKEIIFNKSFFEQEKLIIINRVSEKIFKFIDEIFSKKIEDVFFILWSGSLDKKSKLRKLFETDKKSICIPFYEESLNVLVSIVQKFMREKNINISQQVINIIAERAKGDRINLKNELTKIENFIANKKKITPEDVIKITNLSENYSISELVDGCLSKNKNKVLKILNENNFSSDECILIIRTFLGKLKRLLKLHQSLKSGESTIEKAILSHKPPIFWKDKEMLIQQIKSINLSKTKDLIYKTSELERVVKKNPYSSINITTDFLVNHKI